MKEFLNKYKVIIIIVVIALIIVILLNTLNKKENNNYMISKYLNGYGFELIDNETDLYYKQVSNLNLEEYSKAKKGETDYLYFKLSDRILRETYLNKEDTIRRSYSGEYDYNTGILNYSYELDDEGSYIMINGTYSKDGNKSTCTLVDTNGFNNTKDLKKTSCETAKYYSKEFNSIVDELNKDNNLILLLEN